MNKSLIFSTFWDHFFYLFYFSLLLDLETNLLSGCQVHVHGDAGVLPVDLAGVRDGVVAEVHVGGELIEAAVEEEGDVDRAVVEGGDLGGEGCLDYYMYLFVHG